MKDFLANGKWAQRTNSSTAKSPCNRRTENKRFPTASPAAMVITCLAHSHLDPFSAVLRFPYKVTIMLLPPRATTLGLLLATLVLASTATLSAEDPVPNDPPLRYLKGNLHTHSLWSDGDDFPEMIAEWYRTNGYQFLALSDHNTLSEGTRWMKQSDIAKRGGAEALAKYQTRFGGGWVETRGEPSSPEYSVRLKPLNEFRSLVEERGKFLMIQSEEISDRAEGKPLHINAANIKEAVQPLSGSTITEAIEANLRALAEQAEKSGQPILPHVNHPNFHYAVTAEDIAAALSDQFFEVYNGHPSVNHEGDHDHPSIARLWDIANTIRIAQLASPPLYGVATDDSHDYHTNKGSLTGRGWVMVRARYLTPEHLIRAMRAGNFYASSGVVLNNVSFDADTGKLHIEIEPQEGVTYSTQFIGTPADYDPASKPRVDKNGKELDSTRSYSEQVGQVFATEQGTSVSYQVTGKELYVRAVITSSKHHPDPSFGHQHEQAWTQPVGWESHLKPKVSAE